MAETTRMEELPVQQRQQHSEDDEVTKAIKGMIQNCGDGDLSSKCCIYRVPFTPRQYKEEAFTPKVVSIGPFHYDEENKRLQDTQRHKHIMLSRFTERVQPISLDDDLVGNLIHSVGDLESEVRASYSESIKFTKDDLTMLILMNGGFIIELFIMSNETNKKYNDPKLSQEWLLSCIYGDLILLENQLPFFIIKKLLKIVFPDGFPRNQDEDANKKKGDKKLKKKPHNLTSLLAAVRKAACGVVDIDAAEPNNDAEENHDGSRGLSILELTCECLRRFNTQYLKPGPGPNDEIKHFTNLYRSFYLQGKKSPPRPISWGRTASPILCYNVNALKEAGIKLKKAGTSKCSLDLKFSGHVQIPQIHAEDVTELLFRNMIALEQCLYPDETYISDYALILDCLIDTHKDMDLLVREKIVRNFLLGDAGNVASLFNGLPKNTLDSTFTSDYLNICESLNSYCEDPWHKMKATLKHDY